LLLFLHILKEDALALGPLGFLCFLWPFNVAMLEQAGPGGAPKTYGVFLGKHAVGNGRTTEVFVRVVRGMYRTKW
jgi:hypothetical protein